MDYDIAYRAAQAVSEVNNPIMASYVADLLGTRTMQNMSRVTGTVIDKAVFADAYPSVVNADLPKEVLVKKRTK